MVVGNTDSSPFLDLPGYPVTPIRSPLRSSPFVWFRFGFGFGFSEIMVVQSFVRSFVWCSLEVMLCLTLVACSVWAWRPWFSSVWFNFDTGLLLGPRPRFASRSCLATLGESVGWPKSDKK